MNFVAGKKIEVISQIKLDWLKPSDRNFYVGVQWIPYSSASQIGDLQGVRCKVLTLVAQPFPQLCLSYIIITLNQCSLRKKNQHYFVRSAQMKLAWWFYTWFLISSIAAAVLDIIANPKIFIYSNILRVEVFNLFAENPVYPVEITRTLIWYEDIISPVW